MAYTLVSFHAHPDDEVLLTGGTLAKAAAAGHRVVLVVATSGEAGAAASALRADGSLRERREDEVRRSAQALGCARVVLLGYPDSGLTSDSRLPQDSGLPPDSGLTTGPGPSESELSRKVPFSKVDPRDAAARLATILREEQADVLTVYDPAGGYGHPDHRQVHVVGVLAAQLAGTRVVLEATLDRTLMLRLARLTSLIPGGLGGLRTADFQSAFTPGNAITHRIDVRAEAPAKRRAMQAHASQATSDGGPRTLSMLLRLPPVVFNRLLGREWFVERGRSSCDHADDIFATLRAEKAIS